MISQSEPLLPADRTVSLKGSLYLLAMTLSVEFQERKVALVRPAADTVGDRDHPPMVDAPRRVANRRTTLSHSRNRQSVDSSCLEVPPFPGSWSDVVNH